eukprot:7384533-Prymnesium_polylepis.2
MLVAYLAGAAFYDCSVHAVTGLRAPPVAMAFYPVQDKKVASPVRKALKKNSGALTVSVEYSPTVGAEHVAELEGAAITTSQLEGATRRVRALGEEERLTLLSAKLRDADVAALWTADIDAVAVFATEQATAKGDFPGPCPVVFNGDCAHAAAAVDAGASAVVLTAAHLEESESFGGVEVIWDVSSADEISQIGEAGATFLFPAEDAAALAGSLPSDCLAIAAGELRPI